MKKLFFIVQRSLAQHKLSTFITILSAALAVGLVMSVFSIKDQAHRAFTGGPVGFDAVLGAKGSKLQLVLNSVFHLETSPGNIPWRFFQYVSNNDKVDFAVPYAVGDNYKGYRIVGTTKDLFEKLEYRKNKKLEPVKGGKIFDPKFREAVIGSYVAQKTGLKRGLNFNPSHGTHFESNERHSDEFMVSGVLKPTNSPIDRVIWIPIEWFYKTEGHVLRGWGEEYVPKPDVEIPDRHKEVSAIMIKLKNPASGFMLSKDLSRQGDEITLAWPIGAIMAEFFDKIAWINKILTFIAYIVVVVAIGSILASIYNTMNERRREFAILRALGAKRRTVFSTIVFESTTIAFLGVLIGFLVYALIIATASFLIRRETGVVLDVFQFHPILVVAPLGMTVLGTIAGLIPAIKAYSTSVADELLPIT